MAKGSLSVIFAIVTSGLADQIKVYQSTASLNDTRPLSGLHLVNDKPGVDLTKQPGFSICGRFNFKRFTGKQTVLFRIEGQEWSLFRLLVGYKITFFAFGNTDAYGSSPSWAIREIDKRGQSHLRIWYPNRWHHVCLSYQREGSHLSLIKVTFKEQTATYAFQ